MKIICKKCGSRVPLSAVQPDEHLATCANCGTVFDIGEKTDDGPLTPAARQRKRKPMPEAFTVSEGDSGMSLPPRMRQAAARGSSPSFTITRRWRSLAAAGYVFCLLAWIGFGVFVVMGGFDTSNTHNSNSREIAIFLCAVGLPLTYITIALLLNRTTIHAGNGMISVRHGPIPWWGERDLAVASIKQLYCKEHVAKSKNGTSYTYSVYAQRMDGKPIALVADLPIASQALFLEQELEKRLAIVDVPVEGEYLGW